MAGWSQASTPEAALEEIATATKVGDIEKHFPAKILKMIDDLSPKEKTELRQELAKEFLIGEHLKQEGLQLRKTGDGHTWEVVKDDGDLKGTIVVKKSFVSGIDALVILQATDRKNEDKDRSMSFTISMSLEDGEWRVTGFGEFRELDFESEEFLGRFRPNPRNADAGAASFLRTLTTDLITYASTYPTVGFPASIEVLSGEQSSESSPDHAKLLPPGVTGNPVIREGFEFHYQLIDAGVNGKEGKYRITARPVEFGKSGTMNLFIDESAVIRFTKENREANENDPPL
jgi:hypothetical protein